MKNTDKKFIKKLFSVLLVCIFVLMLGACGKEEAKPSEKIKKIGKEGENNFYLEIVKNDKETVKYEIFTDMVTVGAALEDKGLIKYATTEKGETYVSEVDGIKADFENSKEYWAVYNHDEYLTSLPDTIGILCGDTYVMKLESLDVPFVSFPESKFQKGSEDEENEEETEEKTESNTSSKD